MFLPSLVVQTAGVHDEKKFVQLMQVKDEELNNKDAIICVPDERSSNRFGKDKHGNTEKT
jgi:hypothetical protein